MSPKVGHLILFVVNFDQLRERIAITICQNQRERLEKIKNPQIVSQTESVSCRPRMQSQACHPTKPVI
jgi:hypothetical protein